MIFLCVCSSVETILNSLSSLKNHSSLISVGLKISKLQIWERKLSEASFPRSSSWPPLSYDVAANDHKRRNKKTQKNKENTGIHKCTNTNAHPHSNIYIYLDLHLALFSAHSSFPLDLRSFWLFTLTWTRKRALVFWPTGIYAFFPGIYAYYPGKYAHNFGFKMQQVQKCQEWCNCARVGENRSKSRNLSNEHLFVLFRGYRYIVSTIVSVSVDSM